MKTFRAMCVSCTAVILAAAGSAHAGIISVSPPPGGEASHQQILESIYGGLFAGTPATNFTGSGASAGITVTRTEDFGNGGVRSTDGSGPVTDDAVWAGGVISATAEARFAGYNQTFGYIPGSSGGSYVNLFNVTGSGYGVSGSASNIDLGTIAGSWRWARSGDNGVHSSLAADNADGMDHMVSYRVTGLTNGAAATWLLFFEDLNNETQCPDWDYNDLAVEVTVLPVPTPGTAALAACSALLMLRRRSKA